MLYQLAFSKEYFFETWINQTFYSVYNYHDSEDNLAFLDLSSGSDAADVKWIEIDSSLDLYASHKDFIKVVIHKVVIDKQTLGHKI